MNNIAVIVPGGLGHKNSREHIPSLFSTIATLSERFEITAYCPVADSSPYRQPECGRARIRYIPIGVRSSFNKKVLRLATAFLSDHFRKRYSMIHAFWAYPAGVTAAVLGNLCSLPVVVSLQGGELCSIPEIPYGNMVTPLSRWAVRQICLRANALVVLTEFQKKQLAQWHIPQTRVKVIPYGVNTATIRFSRRKLDKRPLKLLHIGNLTPVKDQSTLLKAFQIISSRVHSRLRIIGVGELENELRDAAKRFQIADRTEFVGYVEHANLPRQLRWAHFLLHSSLHEAQAVVVSEALASGLAVVGTNVGLIADLNHCGTSAVDIGDYAGLAARVLEMTEDPRLYTEQVNRGLHWAAEHTIQRTAQEIEKVYSEWGIQLPPTHSFVQYSSRHDGTGLPPLKGRRS